MYYLCVSEANGAGRQCGRQETAKRRCARVSVTVAATTFVVVFLAELPDKSLFASLVLGTRYRPLWVWLGVSAAFAVHVLIAVLAGGLLTLLPQRWVDAVAAVLFAGAAVLLLRPTRDEPAAPALPANDNKSGAGGAPEGATQPAAAVLTRSPVRVLATCFAVVFVAEWGDVTQIAIANLAAKYADPLSVGVGATLALVAVAALAIKAGSTVLQRIPVRVLHIVAGGVMAILAVIAAAQLFR